MDVLRHNREAWDRQVAAGNRWTVPVGPEVIARARTGDWSILLTPTRPVPRDWMGDLRGLRVLALASGGGELDAGLSVTGLYEDGRPDGGPLDELLPCFLATRAVK